MVTRPSTIRQAPDICTWGSIIPGGERDQVANICSDQEAVPRLELCARSARGREGGLEADWVEEEGGFHRFRCPLESLHWWPHWQGKEDGGARRLMSLICGCFPRLEPNSESFMGVGGDSGLRFNDPRHELSPSLADAEELMFIRVECGLSVRSVRISCRTKPQTHTMIHTRVSVLSIYFYISF